jgi:DNA primase
MRDALFSPTPRYSDTPPHRHTVTPSYGDFIIFINERRNDCAFSVSMRISEDKIAEIREAADIVEVVGGFVRLKKVGRNYAGLCPFHQEKAPSFNVNPERGIYKCFGCGRGGNAFTFLMELERISFVEAVQELAERYQITIPRETPEQKQTVENLDALYEVNRLAARFFYDTLQSERGKAGADYFRRRRWEPETQQRFGLGYAPDAWEEFISHARGQGFSDDLLEQAGLIIRKESGRAYDRFRGRVMFPIFSVTKKVIGFGARALKPDEEPKYLNSPETAVYIKSRVLFGLSHAVPDIRTSESVILVEGYADVISLHQAGIRNAVATSGTALTPDQVRILSRYTKNLFFLYDADSAGFAAMLRGIDTLLEQDCDPRIVQLSAGEDPDSYVQRFGADALRERLNEAVSFVDFISLRYREAGKLEHPEGRTEAVRHIVSLLAKMDDRIRRDFYVHHVAEKYRIYESLLYDELEKLLRRKKGASSALAVRSDAEPRPDEEADRPAELPKTDRIVLELLLRAAPEVQMEVLQHLRIDYFEDDRLRYLLHLVLEQQEHEGFVDLNRLDARLGDDVTMHTVMADLLLPRNPISERWSEIQTVTPPDDLRAILDGYKRMVRRRLERRRGSLMASLQQAGDNPERSVHIATSLMEVMKTNAAIEQAKTFHDLPDVEEA